MVIIERHINCITGNQTKKTVIIANRRRGSDYWEGYIERLETEAKEWVDYYHSLGQMAKVFPSMTEYRADCEKLLDKWEAKRAEGRLKHDKF